MVLILAAQAAVLGGRAQAQAAEKILAPARGEFMPLRAPCCNGVADLALIYQGGTHRIEWNPGQFKSYLTWKHPKTGKAEWLFDGFLFLELKDGQGRSFTEGHAPKPARKSEWVWYLDRLFETGRGLSGLDQAIAETSAAIGPPARPRQVVLMIPDPNAGQKDWGDVKGAALDFDRASDRLAAVRWYLKELNARWEAAGFKQIKLAGYYWLSEDTKGRGEEILPSIAQAVHAQNHKFFWIPYWKAPGSADWKRWGFDAVYQQPNHFFNPLIPEKRLAQAVELAREKHMGLETEWDERAIREPEKFGQRLEAYLDAYEKSGACDIAAMAHYEGGGALLSLRGASSPDLQALYNRYCEMIAKRQRKADAAALANPEAPASASVAPAAAADAAVIPAAAQTLSAQPAKPSPGAGLLPEAKSQNSIPASADSKNPGMAAPGGGVQAEAPQSPPTGEQ